MVLNIKHINNFIKYFSKYNNFAQLNGSQIGSYKTHHNESYVALTSDLELSANSFYQFFHKAFKQCNIEPDKTSAQLFSFLNNIIKNDTTQAYAQSHFDQSEISYFKDFIKKCSDSYEGLNILNPFNSVVENTQMPISDLSDSQTINTLAELNLSINDSVKLESFFEIMERNLSSKLQKTLHDQVGEELHKHLGINKNMTSQEVNDCKNKLGYTYQSIMRKENQIRIIESHTNNKTTPKALSHQNFPAPFIAFNSRSLFIDKYNKIIETAQMEIMNLEIEEFKEDIKILNNDVDIFIKTLQHHVSNIDETKKEIYKFQEDKIKKSLESAHVKVAKVQITPFVAKQSNDSSMNINNKSSKQFQTVSSNNNSNRSINYQTPSNNTNSNDNSSRSNNYFNVSNNFSKRTNNHSNRPNKSSYKSSNNKLSNSNSNSQVKPIKPFNTSHVNKIFCVPLLITYPNNSNYVRSNTQDTLTNQGLFFRKRSKNLSIN